MTKLAQVLLVALLWTTPTLAAERKWDTPDAGAKLGLFALQCDDRDVCVALACPQGRPQLVSIAPGGGPFEGKAVLAVGPDRHELGFVWDDAVIDVMGSAGSRAAVPPQVFAALRREAATLIGTNSGPFTVKISPKGLDRFWDRIVAACPVVAATPTR